MNYYNDNDAACAATLRELIEMKLLPQGEIDTRSIVDVKPNELVGYRQCHFFCGCGGWPLALQLAGWGEREGVWSGSAPCPPFSVAGKKKYCPACEGDNLISHPCRTGVFVCCACGHEWLGDERHLWPELFRLIRACKPRIVMGEQVAGANGEVWLTGVRACLEAQGYGFRAADMCAAGVGAPQIRQRLFWLGYDLSAGLERWQKQPARDQCAAIERVGDVVGMADGGRQSSAGRGNGEDVVGAKKVAEGETRQRERLWDAVDDCGANGGLADGNGGESGNGELQPIGKHRFVPQDGGIAHGLANGENDGRNQVSANDAGSACGNVAQGSAAGLGLRGSFSGLAYKSRERRNGRCDSAESHGRIFVEASSGLVRPDGIGVEQSARAREFAIQQPRQRDGAFAASAFDAWDDFECVPCADGCVRRIEAGTFPLVSAGMDAKATRKWLARMLRGFMPGRNIRERRANARGLAAAIVAAQKGRAQSAAQPVANGVPVAMVCGDDSRGPQDEISFAEVQATAEERVMRLRMYGNAIVPQLAAEFILAFEDEMSEQ